MVIGTAAMYYIGSLHVLGGTLTLGSLLVFSAYLLMLYQPLSPSPTPPGRWKARLPAQNAVLKCWTGGGCARFTECGSISSAKGAIAFQSVNFGYAGDRHVLRDINLRIDPNQIVGLVGGTGAGKSTLIVWCRDFTILPRVSSWSMTVTCGRSQKKVCERRSQLSYRTHCFFPQPSRKHRLRPVRCHGRRNYRSGAAGAGRRFIQQMPDGYCQRCRRTRRALERWPASAHRYCPRIFKECADLAAGRTHIGARSRNRSCDHGNHPGINARPDNFDCDASAGDDPWPRSNHCARTRALG